jgi:effector-binding domain-containing protein
MRSRRKLDAAQVNGPYKQTPSHYTEMLAWLDAEGWDVVGPPREVYLKRPDAKGKGDPKEFVTEIQFPIKA